MKNLANIVLASALTSNLFLVDAVAPAVPEVKLTQIKEENINGATKKLVQSGFLKPSENSKYSKKPSQKNRSLKAGRNSPLRGARRQQAGRTLHQETDDWYNDYFQYHDDDFLSSGKGGNPDDDYYVGHPDEGDDHYPDDDYYHGKGYGKGHGKGKGSKKSKKSKKGKGHYRPHDEDDYYVIHHDSPPMEDDMMVGGDDLLTGDDDVLLAFGEIPYEIEGFIDVRNVDPPIFADPSDPNTFAAGNVQLYVDTPMWEIDGVEASALIGLVQGTCTRTDPADEGDVDYEGSGVCSLTFEAIVGDEIVASFTAEGRVINPDNSLGRQSILTIKGGLGEFAGVSGEIILQPATLDVDSTPPFPSLDDSLDFFNVMDGYIFEGVLFSTVAIDIFIEDDDAADPSMPDDDGMVGEPVEVVTCPGQAEQDFCDCNGDCVNFPETFCACEEAQACCGNSSV